MFSFTATFHDDCGVPISFAPTNSDVLPYGRMNALTSLCGPRRVRVQQMRRRSFRASAVEFAQANLHCEQIARDRAERLLKFCGIVPTVGLDAAFGAAEIEPPETPPPTGGPARGGAPPGAGVAPGSMP